MVEYLSENKLDLVAWNRKLINHVVKKGKQSDFLFSHYLDLGPERSDDFVRALCVLAVSNLARKTGGN